MLQIRDEQLRALEEARFRQLEEQTIAHVREFFPGECASAGERAVRDGIHEVVERARIHGFTSERSITKFVNLAFTFGRKFDRDPQLSWAAEILNDDRDAEEKMNRLYMTGIERADEGAGFLHDPEES